MNDSPILWWYASGNQKYGPYTQTQLHELARSGDIRQDDLVWHQGLDNWVPARSIEGLVVSPPPVMPQQEPETVEPAEAQTPAASVDLLAVFVGDNYAFYARKWTVSDRFSGIFSWNWAAFFLGLFWLAYRKMYWHCGIIIAAGLLFMGTAQVLQIPPEKMMQWQINAAPIFSMLMGLFSNWMYRKHAERTIRQITATYSDPEQRSLQLAQQGGASMTSAAAIVAIAFVLPMLVSTLIAQFTGWIAPPEWLSVQDPFALCLAFALAIKESWFLLWVLGAILGEQEVARQMVSARTLGYSRLQAWRLILIPQLLPRLGWPMAAVFAYGLSVVDMAIILGPSNPPTLAVLVWHWLSNAAPLTQALGSAAAIAMFFILLLIVAISRILWRLSCKVAWLPSGKRAAFNPSPPSKATPSWTWRLLALTGYLVLATLLLWSVAPELPRAALEAVASGRAARSMQAQVDLFGFRFKDLSLKCASIWHLPSPITQLIRGIDNTRANLSRICVDTARHLSSGGPEDPALPADIAEASQLIPGASLEWLAEQLPGIEEPQVLAIVERAADLLEPPLH